MSGNGTGILLGESIHETLKRIERNLSLLDSNQKENPNFMVIVSSIKTLVEVLMEQEKNIEEIQNKLCMLEADS